MKIQLSDHFNYKKLFKFTLPSVIMMLFISIYGVVDGLFVANFVGSNSLSSINIVLPMFIVVGAFGFMLGTGGGAEVSRTLGEGQREKANQYFTMIIITIIAAGIILSILCIAFIEPICCFLGASDLLIKDCITYGIILSLGMTAFMLQTAFQTFFIVSGKPNLGLALTVAAGIANMILDFVFIYILKMGVAGAAIATVIGYIIGGILPFIYFLLPNKSLLKLVKPKLYPKILLHSCANGSSEMLSNISMSITTFLYNWQMMRLAGEDGVAAITVIMYVNFIFISVLIGFSIGTAPIIGYNYGSGNIAELKNIFRKSITVVGVVSVIMFILAEITAVPAVSIFVGKENFLSEITISGFRLYSLSFLICGLNIFGSSFFTALCNGKISAAISFLRTLLLQAGLIIALPFLIGINGVWLSVVISELLTSVVTILFFIIKRKKYQYA